ncbi:fructose bisphosphate aldolase [Ruegeria pomeroyi]|uniref:fructose-bisphosphate aldolase n=1 Tax=Ruegeria pomeroyi TaxID=89184 RepID=A0A9Q3WHV2_9RHOB|nr:fructose bisphosphate aldolase [Ruegeria pomeroyi]MCE8507018.1 fructose bisphosphate aldolase [Ruegeria pomeroyi]MCE8511425.1 fructose bisphosphate aldolase [Ruegeria pomeroyi]MCE8524033.1 fructose bisphosphate aldolase [Ruegeria pomeroyi]MCE8527935.1 fructose bisphosphate aldolase [Ruegeria pomeroyi]MCE8536104.1 fructose bisphosphate aldolase [Ruegeria pomeroyi]
MSKAQMREQMANGAGFIAALDQSGGSTPKALALYGVDAAQYGSEEEMFAEIQRMRARIILADDFTSKKVIGAILFERTLGESIEGRGVADYLWNVKGVVPFLKIDKGLEDEANGVQMMKPIPGLAATLAKATGVFGTKERSVIHEANAEGIAAVVAQQFDVAREVIAAGMVPIVEPEVNIHSTTKSQAEEMLKEEILKHLDTLDEGQDVMLKLTIPSTANLYDALADHPRVVRVVALSGGYSTDQACDLLSRNGKMIASFSRALTEGLSKQQSDAEFNAALGGNIDKIYRASL